MRIIPPQATADAAPPAPGRAPGAKPGAAWLWVAPLLAALCNLWSTVSPNDFWTHLTAGRWIAQHGHIPTTNLFTWGAPLDAPYAYPSWGAAWLMYETLYFTGLSGIVVLRALCVALTWAILGAVAWRRIRRAAPALDAVTAARIVCLVSLLSFGLAATNLDARPQTLVLPLFALSIAAVFEIDAVVALGLASKLGSLMAVVLGSAVWTNFHGSFVLGVAIPLLALLCETMLVVTRRGGSTAGAKVFALWGVAAAAGMLLNPRGLGVLNYVTQLNANHTVQRFIYEWQAPRFGDGPGTLFYGAAAVTLILGALVLFLPAVRGKTSAGTQLREGDRTGLRCGELLLLLAFFYLATRSIRSILWFALVLIPCAATLGAVYWSRRPAGRPAAPRRGPCRLARRVCIALGFALLLSLPPVRAQWVPVALMRGYARSPWGEDPYILDPSTPVSAANYMLVVPRPAAWKLWNDMGQGAYLSWALPPGQTQCDSRIELYSDGFWREYLAVCAGGPGAEQRLERAGITDVLCNAKAQPKLVAYLQRSAKWRAMPFGQNMLFQRRRSGR